MEVIEVDINDLKPAEYNPRGMTPKEAKDLTQSLTEFDMVEPIVVNKGKGRENVIIGGHQRWYVLKGMGRRTIPVVYVDLPDIEKEKELNLRLNKNLGHWDWELMANFDEDFLKKVGFITEELDRVFKGIKEDELILLDEVNISSKQGEVYVLGRHRLACGDSAKPDTFKSLFGEEKARLIFTDPPYNVNYGYDWRNSLPSPKGKKVQHHFFSDKKTDKEYEAFLKECFLNACEFSKRDTNFYCWFADRNYGIVKNALTSAGLFVSQVLIWGKNFPVFSLGQDFHRTWEPCFHGWKKGVKHFFNKVTNFRDIINQEEFVANFDMWFEDRDSIFEYEHPTQKPVKLAERAIIKSSERDDIILDMYGGSGSTLIAAEQLNRRCYMIELDPIYCDVIRKRYARFIGKEAEWQEITPKQ